MNGSRQKRIVGLLGVGFDHQDGHIRITQADQYQVVMGSQDSHRELQKICSKIEQTIQSSGRKLQEYTPEEFVELLAEIY
jgi:hypothetical protein